MKIANQYLVRLGEVHHTGQFDSDIADDVAEHRGINPLRLVQLIVATDVIGGANHRHRITPGGRPGCRVVCHHQQHEVEQVLVRGRAQVPVPDVVAIAGSGAGEIDLDALCQQFVIGGIKAVGQAVELAGLFKRRMQREFDDVQQQHRTALDIAQAVALDQLLDRFQDVLVLGQRGIEFDERRRDIQALADLEQLLPGLATSAGYQLPDEGLVIIARSGAGGSTGAVVAEKIVRHENHQQAALVRAPAQHNILAQPPLPAQGLLKCLEIAALDDADGVVGLAIA